MVFEMGMDSKNGMGYCTSNDPDFRGTFEKDSPKEELQWQFLVLGVAGRKRLGGDRL
ncbi:MAG: hypothetical protein IPJ89_02600 [Candidatus Iainarchaeum archaeon]|uniref:Uncharacterized protein n=1 Tax=Candidatus Iainarchaeum sp. TaxID=3101447 RepID=A0A7T9DKQ4_9ARCH|nr:MAG: hypothetical protein IPJ89_02600 [Candidatus Diapherotrites archaeon]